MNQLKIMKDIICTKTTNELIQVINEVYNNQNITLEQLKDLLSFSNDEVRDYLFKTARNLTDEIYGKEVFTRGLIEFSNYCKNDCYYCGIQKSKHIQRYRLTLNEILECCEIGHEIGYRTFVLQSGEDLYFNDARICEIVRTIKEKYPDCSITLSIGERSKESYNQFFTAGADRYLLRHETANTSHYSKLHPSNMSLKERKTCLDSLKEIGYQIGCGFMVGSPYQSVETLYEDLMYIKTLQPHMVGIGPFIPASETPFENKCSGSLEDTLRLLSIIRLIHPSVLLPSTTSLGTIDPTGREQGILAGANVIMPNLSPTRVRKQYMLYDNKICTGDAAIQCRFCIQGRIGKIGYKVAVSRGDSKVV